MKQARRTDYDRLAAHYDQRYEANPLAGIAKALEELVGRAGAERVLEAGCGTGYWIRALEKAGRLVVGMDRSGEMLARAGERTVRVQGSADQLPFRGATFDLVYSVNAIHHFGDPAGFVAEAARLLRPGGALGVIGIDPRRIERRYAYEYFAGTRERDLERYPPLESLADWMKKAGLGQVETTVVETSKRAYRGREVFSDPFLAQTSHSMFATLSETEYEEGLERMRHAAARDASLEFSEVLDFYLVAGQSS